MKSTSLLLILAVFGLSSPTLAEGAAGFGSFQSESSAMTDLIKCPDAEITKTEGLPDLYGCIYPGAEVLKVFINAADDNQSVETVKVMWNDWSKDAGYGVHTDKAIADAWSATIATRYAPEQVEEVVSVLHGNADKTIENDNFVLAYTFSKGPAIDERLITITAK